MTASSDGLVNEIARNRILWACLSSWFAAQVLKVLLGIYREKRFNFKWFVGSGGMPSSHAATVASLAAAFGLVYGFDSALFAAVSVFAFIIMFDAQGVRRQSGKQAEALNHILDDINAQKGISGERLKELFGHTPVEVLAGAFIGILVATLVLSQ